MKLIMKETFEIQTLFVRGDMLKSGYQLMEVDGEVHKIAFEDVERLKEALLSLEERKEKALENDFDDFTYDPRVEPNSEPKEYAKVATLDEIKKIFEKLKSITNDRKEAYPSYDLLGNEVENGFYLDRSIEVKNVVNLPEKFLEWFSNSERRKASAKLFLATKSGVNLSDSPSSFIGTYQYFTEGTEMYDFNGSQIGMLEVEEPCKIVGVKYTYMYGPSRGARTFRSIDDNDINEVRHYENEFRKQHYDASIINLIVKRNGYVCLVSPDCLILNQNVVKKGV